MLFISNKKAALLLESQLVSCGCVAPCPRASYSTTAAQP